METNKCTSELGHEIKIARIYDYVKTAEAEQKNLPGLGPRRILVDRLWPRGMSKNRALLDDWAKQIAPSSELRKWFSHDPSKFDEFSHLYIEELSKNSYTKEFLQEIKNYLCDSDVVLLYGAKDTHENQAVVLLDYIHKHLI